MNKYSYSDLIKKHCNEECLFKGNCCEECSLGNLKDLKFGIFLVDENKEEEFNIDLELDYSKKYIYLHINPKELGLINCDYYVKISDLLDLRNAKKYIWSKDNIDLKTSISDIDGEYLTSLMTDSSAADYVRKLGGFIGSMVQMDFLLKNHGKIDKVLERLGYKPDHYSSTNLWSSSQRKANNAWYWYSGGYWNYYHKTNADLVLPLFSFSSL